MKKSKYVALFSVVVLGGQIGLPATNQFSNVVYAETNQAKNRPIGNEPEQIAKLQENYNYYLSLNKNDYTEESWEGSIPEAYADYTLMILTDNEIQAPPMPANMLNMFWEWFFGQLIKKPVTPQINTSKLQEAINNGDSKITEGGWVDDSSLKILLEDGRVVLATPESQAQVDDITARINDAINELKKDNTPPVEEKIDYKNLEEASNKANEIISSNDWIYTNSLEKALENATFLLNNIGNEATNNITQKEVDESTEWIYLELNKLEKKQKKNPIYVRDLDRSKLNQVYDKYHSLVESDYTTESWKAFIKQIYGGEKHDDFVALIDAMNSIHNLKPDFYLGEEDDPSSIDTGGLKASQQAYFDLITADVQKALDLLVPISTNTENPDEVKVNKDTLKDLVDKSNKKDTSKSTEESKKAFDTALDNAKKVLKDDKATQKQVDEATSLLDTALKGLKDKSGISNLTNNDGDKNKEKGREGEQKNKKESSSTNIKSKDTKKVLPKTGENTLLSNILIAFGLTSLAGISILKRKKTK